jgi:hypothetical protein
MHSGGTVPFDQHLNTVRVQVRPFLFLEIDMNFLSLNKMQQFAVMQFVGFRHAEQGHSIDTLVESMGLSIKELELIKDDPSVQPYYDEVKKLLLDKN